MDETDRIIAALIRLMVRGWPAAVEPAGVQMDADRVRELVSETLDLAPVVFRRARNRAYAVAHEESGEPTPTHHYDEEGPGLEQWWADQTRTLTALLDSDVPPAVVLGRARSIVEREASSQVSKAHGEGIRDVADARGLKRLLTPERDACLICTSYAGAVAPPGEGFRPVRNFTGRELPDEAIELPIHPRCRCDSRVLYSDQEAEFRSDVLKREAERQVLRFESLPSESDRKRTEAAERLLAEGTRLAKTVRETAQRRIRQRRKTEAQRSR